MRRTSNEKGKFVNKKEKEQKGGNIRERKRKESKGNKRWTEKI